ncbi:MAG TPA: hypothetical protein VGX25_15000 [Actinophytocola sp.]|uniref:hypothetical protein n=1 Tax=Actinophytocola sp. TaxID=1872138 RepID=UPI002DDCA9CE|nr:hypothetical protein [Actinophytocola sp.]HEV2780695.1 hypothetical protein [Actinophytocola sp.]
MYVDNQGAAPTGTAGGWQVDPDQVRDFAEAVSQVRQHLDAIRTEVGELASPSYAPMLGTSPVGQELAEKFTDRMGSETGLRGQLDVALKRMEEFVESAEKTAASYQEMDSDSAAGYRYS